MFLYDEIPHNIPPSEALGFSGNLDAMNEAGERFEKAKEDIRKRKQDRKKAQGIGETGIKAMSDRIKDKKNNDDDVDTNYIQYQ